MNNNRYALFSTAEDKKKNLCNYIYQKMLLSNILPMLKNSF